MKDRTKLSASDIMELLSFITTTTYFSFRGTIYQQNFGTAMGSPVSPGLANIFMDDGEMKLWVYRKKTHTDQYLNFKSHHPLQHKLGVVRTLLDRCNSIVTEEKDKETEETHIEDALNKCGYPNWTINKIRKTIHQKNSQSPAVRKQQEKRNKEHRMKGMVVLPYIKGTTEAIPRVMTTKRKSRSYMKYHYRKNCKLSYIRETGRQFGQRLGEHRKEADKMLWRSC